MGMVIVREPNGRPLGVAYSSVDAGAQAVALDRITSGKGRLLGYYFGEGNRAVELESGDFRLRGMLRRPGKTANAAGGCSFSPWRRGPVGFSKAARPSAGLRRWEHELAATGVWPVRGGTSRNRLPGVRQTTGLAQQWPSLSQPWRGCSRTSRGEGLTASWGGGGNTRPAPYPERSAQSDGSNGRCGSCAHCRNIGQRTSEVLS